MDDSNIIRAFKQMQVPLMIVGPKGEIVHYNAAASRLFGYDADELTERAVFDVLPVTSVSELRTHVEPPDVDAVISGMRGRKKNGDQFPLLVHLSFWSDPEQGYQYALMLRDITEEAEATRSAEDEMIRADSALRGARIGVFEYNPLADTIIVNGIWRALMELEDDDPVDVQIEWRKRVHPDDLAAALRPMSTCLEGSVERDSCEYRLRSKDGSCWRWMRTDVSVAKLDDAGRPVRLVGAMTEVTERKAIENALRKSLEQFKSSFDNASIGKAIVGLDGRWLRVNPALCKLLGYTEEELLKTDFQTITHPDDLNEDLSKRDFLKTGNSQVYQMNKRYIHANGTIIWALLNVSLVRDAEGRPDHFISQIVDMTEQRQLSEMKSEFVSTVSHELRTPLTSILGSLALLSSMDDNQFSDDVQRLLYIAQENGRRLHALVDDILDFEKVSTMQMRFKLSRHDIAGLVEDAVFAALPIAEKFDVRVEFDYPNQPSHAFVDPKRFQQVMTNLLSNAAKFATAGSRIEVAVQKQEESIRISVTNDGEGIPDQFRDHIFKPFSQASVASGRERGGTGLGLNISKQIVEKTGGTIGFDSAPGGQTIFWFTVPINEPIKA